MKGALEENTLRKGESIKTDDLCYESPGEKYSFKFSYLGHGIFLLCSAGYADENSIKNQIQNGNEARVRLAKQNPGMPFHLIWDVSKMQGASIFARYELMLKALSPGTFASLNAVGGNNMVKSFSKVIKLIIPQLNVRFFKSQDEAIYFVKQSIGSDESNQINNTFLESDTDLYANFIDMWQKNPSYGNFGNRNLKIFNIENWKNITPENNFKGSCSIIEGNIVLYSLEGFIKAPHIETIYQILENVLTKIGYTNSSQKFYTIINLKKVKGISLDARKLTNYYEELYKHKAHMVIIVPSPLLNFALKVQKRINPSSFNHWQHSSSIEEAFALIENHKNGFDPFHGVPSSQEDKLEIPEDKEELTELVKKLYQENQQIKQNQHEHIQKILEITGRMTWDESFSENFGFTNDTASPFADVYNALAVIKDDFQEILREKMVHVQKLRESEEKYWNIINLANDIILVYQENACKLVNSRTINVIGYTPEEVKSGNPLNFISEVEFNRIKASFFSKPQNSTSYFETIIKHKNGTQVPVSVSVGSITYEEKPAAMLIIRDITAKKNAEAELDKYRNHLEVVVAERTRQLEKEIIDRESAEKSDKLKSAFLSNMSHEIRTPMNAIIAFSNFLRNPEISEDQREEYISYIQSSGQSLMNLINDIIDISKIEAKQINLQKITCLINPILEELYVVFAETLKNKGCAALQLMLSKKIPSINLILKTDPYRVKQILSNLLDNAVKFTDKGFIEFGYELKGSMIEFFVKDSGIGIQEDKQELIFERFGKIETVGKNKGGTGLGLAISRNLAIILGGSLTVKSFPGSGSTFYLRLPYAEEQQLPVNHTNIGYIEKNEYNWENKKILVAEDEDLNFKVIQIALQKTKANIIRAENGKEAIESIHSNQDIAIVLMDIQMPEMDGYEALTRIKQINYQLPVIAQTAFAMVEDKDNCLRLGFNDYISKPLKISELLMKIDLLIS